MAEQMTQMKAIRTFFEADGGRSLKVEELKALSTEERASLAEQAGEALGVEIVRS